MSDERKKAYQARFERVLDHIEAHLHAPLEVEQLAAVAHFSRFHFQRQFADFTGVGVARYILLMRLKHASLQLAFQSQRRIIDIPPEAGFENPGSFFRCLESGGWSNLGSFRPNYLRRFGSRVAREASALRSQLGHLGDFLWFIRIIRSASGARPWCCG